MQTVSRSTFTTIKTEGAILPADLLQRVHEGALDGMRPQDYHLAPNERLRDAVSRSWNRLRGVWPGFDEARRALGESDSGTSLTRERWLLILFEELGYGRLPYRGSLPIDGPSAADDDDGARYPISHAYEGVPIHLVSFRRPLDRLAGGERGERFRRSPHSLLQEFLNRSADALWGFVANGLQLRVLRDNASLTRAAFLEFDLEAMMTGERFADFSVLWLVCHVSRVARVKEGGAEGGASQEDDSPSPLLPLSRSPSPADCWLERWSAASAEQGTRALDSLRDGVREAIEALGRGFLAQPANGALRDRLRAGTLDGQAYYRQLLRLVYRLVFLFVAEDRDLLLLPGAEAETRRRYTDYYSAGRLRALAAARRGGAHPDLYRGLRRVGALLRDGYAPLGLPALGGFLFSERAAPELDAADLSNEALLAAVRALAFTIEGQVLRPVDYRNLGAEELGSVYESLLELHPALNVAAATFTLASAAGSERKTTGSYYTPTSLITSLLDSALEPVVAERLAAARRGWEEGSGGVGSGGVGSEGVGDERDSVISGFEGVARGDEAGGDVLPLNPAVSSGRTLRADIPDQASRRVDTGQHRRGLRPGDEGRLHPFPADSSGLAEGTGNADAVIGTGESGGATADRSRSGAVQDHRRDAPIADSGVGEEGSGGVGSGGVAAPTPPRPHSPTPPLPHSPPPSLSHSPPPSLSQTLQAALLDIKVVDPAVGSGHFLIAAANRLAGHLARLRTGDDEPSPAARRDALRDVVGRCLYGVDLNEMAVELCKVGLWLETLDPDRPLSFLDHHIRHGNSLMGATPALLRDGIPDAAFAPLTGDDKAYVAEWKKRNKKEREATDSLPLDAAPWLRLGDLATAMAALEDAPDDTPAAVRAKEAAWARLVNSTDYENNQLLADAWCAAFVFPKHYGVDFPISENDFRDIQRNPHSVPRWMKDEIIRLRERYRFFHWHLAFPEVFGLGEEGVGSRGVGSKGVGEAPTPSLPHSPIPPLPHSPTPPLPSSPTPPDSVTGWTGGFDVVLGNPPWERVKLQEKEWFAQRDPDIAAAPNAAARGRMIAALQKENPAVYRDFLDDRRAAEGESHIARNSGRYPLCGRGDVNTYTLFAELARHLTAERGRAGIIVQSDIATGDTNKFFFGDLIEQGKLVSFYDFVNTEGLFPDVHRTHPHFCLITMSGESRLEPTDFAFWNTNTGHLADDERHFTLTAEEIALLNPNTRTCPIFRSRRDAELTKAIYRRVPVLIKEGVESQGLGGGEENPWGIKFSTMFHMSNDSGLFRTRAELEEAGWRLVGNQFGQDTRYEIRDTSDELRVTSDELRVTSLERSPLVAGHSSLVTYLPLYEAKMLHHFDHRWATYAGGETRDVTAAERDDPAFVVLPRYWVDAREVDGKLEDDRGWLLAFRDITNTTNERTAIFGAIPKSAVGNNAPLVTIAQEFHLTAPLLHGSLSTFASDFVARLSVGGTHMNFFIAKQLPVLPPETYRQPCPWGGEITNYELRMTNEEGSGRAGAQGSKGRSPHSFIPHSPTPSLHDWLLPRVLELTYTAYDLRPFALDCGYHGPPFRWDEARRFLLRCELDAAFFHLYGIARDDVDYIMDTFPIVRRKDEAAHGEYRTKRVILEMYDWMAEKGGIGSGGVREEALTPPFPHSFTPLLAIPPGDPRAAHAWDEAWLGAEIPAGEWWQERDTRGEVTSDERRVTSEEGRKGAGGKGSRGVGRPQTSPLPLSYAPFPAPAGPRTVRLRRAMALGQDGAAAATAELVAFLADEDSSIRWLAGSSLAQRADAAGVVAAIAAFVRGAEAERVAVARPEMARVLEMVVETAEEESVREVAAAELEELGGH